MNAHMVGSSSPRWTRSSRWPRQTLLAVAVTLAAAVVAWFLSTVANVSEDVTVVSVMIAAFIASWVVTNHRTARPAHRVTLVRAHARTR